MHCFPLMSVHVTLHVWLLWIEASAKEHMIFFYFFFFTYALVKLLCPCYNISVPEMFKRTSSEAGIFVFLRGVGFLLIFSTSCFIFMQEQHGLFLSSDFLQVSQLIL